MFWDVMTDVKTGEAVVVVKVGIDRAGNSSSNMIVRGVEPKDDGEFAPAVEYVNPGRTQPLNGKIT